jgi:hypothetical protein
MATIVTRAGKGSPLTHNEVDANFNNLNSDKIETSAIGSTVQAHSAVLDATTASFTTADETKLDGIEAGATADQTAAEILAAVKTVDGAGSGLDADTLDGIQASSFLQGNQTITLSGDLTGSGTTSINAQLAANVVGAAELNVTGNGTTSQYLRSDGDGSFTWATPPDTTANQTITLSGDATGSGTTSIVVTVADDSHNHIISNVDGLQTALDGKASASHTHGWADISGQNSWGGLRHQTSSGYIDFGPANTSWAHIYTDRPNFYFNKELYVNGNPVVVSGTTWSTPSRSGGTTYQNTTGHTVFIIIDSTGNGDYAQVSTNGTSWLNVYYWAGGTGSYERNSLTLVIPDGYYYRITGTAVYSWRELL